MTEQNQSIAYNNKKYLDDWISKNPNLFEFSFEDNVLTTDSNVKINFRNFLASSLLENLYFNSRKYSMSAKEFVKMINIYLTADAIMNNTIHTSDEYVQSVQLNKKKNLVIITDLNEYVIRDINYVKPLVIYEQLSREYPQLKFNILKQTLEEKDIEVMLVERSIVRQDTKNIRFFNLINQKGHLSDDDQQYLDNILHFIYALRKESNSYTGVVEELINKFNLEILYIGIYANGNPDNPILNENQRYVYKSHIEYSKKVKYNQLSLSQKEANEIRKASYGYSSLALIITSVISTVLTLILMFFIMY